MCRMIFLPAGVRPPSRKVARRWLKRLIHSQGGHGAGIAGPRLGLTKAISLPVPLSVRLLFAYPSQPVVWHTRRVSSGAMVDSLCHPFFIKGCGWLVHNGTWLEGYYQASALSKFSQRNWSDTKVAAWWIKQEGWDYFASRKPDGVWIFLGLDGSRSVIVNRGDLVVEKKTAALASEPCPNWGEWYDVADGQYAPGERIKYWPGKPKSALTTVVIAKQPSHSMDKDEWEGLFAKKAIQIPCVNTCDTTSRGTKETITDILKAKYSGQSGWHI